MLSAASLVRTSKYYLVFTYNLTKIESFLFSRGGSWLGSQLYRTATFTQSFAMMMPKPCMRVSSEGSESPVRTLPVPVDVPHGSVVTEGVYNGFVTSPLVASLGVCPVTEVSPCHFQMMVPVWAPESRSSRMNGCLTVR